ncbi:MAG: magnesium/cobalt transporter CorA [Pedobacter sp.]|nr:MAG: magnesium/cobalt transporter CorA [Pedobacter sp.]
MVKTNQQEKRKSKHAFPFPGGSPGQIYIDDKSLNPLITLHQYNSESYQSKEIRDFAALEPSKLNSNFFYWIEVKGFNSLSFFQHLSEKFGINQLILEDITRSYERPKFEEFENFDFIISRMLRTDELGDLESKQISFLLFDSFIISFQEDHSNLFNPILQRLDAGVGNIRSAGSSYLLYTLVDLIIDQYFYFLGDWSEKLDLLDDRLLKKPNKSIMFEAQIIKRFLISLRRIIWAERDKVNDFLRSDSPRINKTSKAYMRDAYDHCIQVMELTESLKELTSSTIDMYLSLISNRLNEIMKVLTVISSIFIPLTFIVGVYGMNFNRTDPTTGKIYEWNMPELYWEHGYFLILGIMLLIAGIQIFYFWRKGWFK